jgi:fatty acid desaturase
MPTVLISIASNSHHVTELDYVNSNPQQQLVADSWIHHQITTTIDFNPESRFANFIFGGFNIYVAHHVFPKVSHEHYPSLTQNKCRLTKKQRANIVRRVIRELKTSYSNVNN